MPILKAFGISVLLLALFSVSHKRVHANDFTEPDAMAWHSISIGNATIIYAVARGYSQDVVPADPVITGDYSIFSAYSYGDSFGAPRFALRVSTTNVKVRLVEHAIDEEFVDSIEQTLSFNEPGYHAVKSTVVLGGRRWYHVQWFDGKQVPMSDLYFTRLSDWKLLSVAGYYYGKRGFWQSNDAYRRQVREAVESVQIITH